MNARMHASLKRIETAKMLKGDVSSDRPEHVCRPLVCRPENEEMLIAQGLLAPPAVMQDVYMCRYLRFHVCTEELCNNHEHGVCSISGLCHGVVVSSFSRSDPRTVAAQPSAGTNDAQPISYAYEQQIRRVRRRHDGMITTVSVPVPVALVVPPVAAERSSARPSTIVPWQKMKDDVRRTLHAIFFSHVREQINHECAAQSEVRLERSIKEYQDYRNARRLPVSLIRIMMIDDNHPPSRTLKIIPYDDALLDRYTAIVEHVYDVIVKYGVQVDRVYPDHITLAVLYTMRNGWTLQGHIMIIADPALIDILPLPNDLTRFKINKKSLTKGTFCMKAAYDNALVQRASMYDLTMNKELHAPLTTRDAVVLFPLGRGGRI